MTKEKHIRFLKKDYLRFKKLRSEGHKMLKNGLSNLVSDDEFHFIESEIVQSLCFRMIEKGVRGAAHYNFNKKKYIELRGSTCNDFGLNAETKTATKGSWLFVIPLEWNLFGGFLITTSAFFRNFLDISFLVNDDLDIYDSTLNNSLEIRGDRVEGSLSYCEIVTRGTYFGFGIDGAVDGIRLTAVPLSGKKEKQ